MAGPDRCASCGDIIPEGGLLCLNCLINHIDKIEKNSDTRLKEYEERKHKLKKAVKERRDHK